MIDGDSQKRLSALHTALWRLRAVTGKDEAELLTTVGRGIGRRAIDMTPTPKSVVDEGSVKKYGERVVEKYFDRAAWPLREKDAHDKRLKKAIREGNVAVAQAILSGGKDTSTTHVYVWDPALVYDAMNRRGQVLKARNYKAVLDSPERREALKKAKDAVGKAKAGWAVGLVALGGSAPAWITRHSGEGAFEDKRKDADPSFRFINRSKWAERSDEAARIRDLALAGTVRSLEKQAQILAEKRLREITRRLKSA